MYDEIVEEESVLIDFRHSSFSRGSKSKETRIKNLMCDDANHHFGEHDMR